MRVLAMRVRAVHGNLPVVIAQVTPEPVSGYQLRTAPLTIVKSFPVLRGRR